MGPTKSLQLWAQAIHWWATFFSNKNPTYCFVWISKFIVVAFMYLKMSFAYESQVTRVIQTDESLSSQKLNYYKNERTVDFSIIWVIKCKNCTSKWALKTHIGGTVHSITFCHMICVTLVCIDNYCLTWIEYWFVCFCNNILITDFSMLESSVVLETLATHCHPLPPGLQCWWE